MTGSAKTIRIFVLVPWRPRQMGIRSGGKAPRGAPVRWGMLRAGLFLVLLGGCAAAPPPGPRTVEHVVISIPPPVQPARSRAVYRRPFHRTNVGMHPSHAPGHAHAPPVRRHGKPPRRHGHMHGHGPGHRDCTHPSHGSKGSHGTKGPAHDDAPHRRGKKPLAHPSAQRVEADEGKGRTPLGRRRM